MILVLAPCGACEWREEGRLLGRVELAPTEAARQQFERWAEGVRPLSPVRIFHGPDELSTATALELSLRLNVPIRAVDDLEEIDAGLWSGLTDAELEARYETAYHELSEAPLNVTPPQGENLGDAAERLRAAVKKCQRGVRSEQAIVLVLRPVALAIVRTQLTGAEEATIWERTQEADETVIVDVQKTPAKPR